MIAITFTCAYLGDQCDQEYRTNFEVFLSPDTMMHLAMRQADAENWSFAQSDPARALCAEHTSSSRGDVAPVRVFERLNQISGVHGHIMVGVEEGLDGRRWLAVGASRNPEPVTLVRVNRPQQQQLAGMIADAVFATIPRPTGAQA